MLTLLDEETLARLERCPRAFGALQLARGSLPSAVRAGAIARTLGMRPEALSRLFSGRIGRSFKSIVQLLRIELALAELERSDCALDHLARVSGYRNARTFSRSFKTVVGLTPSQFRRRLLFPER